MAAISIVGAENLDGIRTDREHTLERGDLICFPPGPASAQRSRRADP
jgi:hypothetical protein